MSESFLIVDINIPADVYVANYAASGLMVHAVARNGQIVQFPTNALQKFVTREGVQGAFKVIFDDAFKLVDVVRL